MHAVSLLNVSGNRRHHRFFGPTEEAPGCPFSKILILSDLEGMGRFWEKGGGKGQRLGRTGVQPQSQVSAPAIPSWGEEKAERTESVLLV